MSVVTDGQPAFPIATGGDIIDAGMSLREYIAIQLMWRPSIGKQGKEFLQARAVEAVAAADALIAELSK